MYRIRHGTRVPIVSNGRFKQIIVRDMAGNIHNLFVDRVEDTYGNVKDALLPHIAEDPLRSDIRLVDNVTFNLVDDHARIIPDERGDDYDYDEPIILQLLLEPSKWTATQKDVIRKTIEGHIADQKILDSLNQEFIRADTPEIIEIREAFVWAINNNPIERLVIYYAPNIRRPVMNAILNIQTLHLKEVCINTIQSLIDVLPRNRTIKSLIIENPSSRSNWLMGVEGLLGAITTNTVLQNLTLIRNDHVKYDKSYDYKMTDLVALLAMNTSLRTVDIRGYRVLINKFDETDPEGQREVAGDLSNLAEVLLVLRENNNYYNRNFRSLILSENRISNAAQTRASEIILALQPIRQDITRLSVLDNRFVQSDFYDGGGYHEPAMLEMIWQKP